MALAYEQYRSEVHKCGHHLEEWKESEDIFGGPPLELVEDLCGACAQVERKERERAKVKPEESVPGTFLRWERVILDEDPEDDVDAG